MNITRILERMASYADGVIDYYDEDGRVARKNFPALRAEIFGVVEKLTRWGVREGMRVGILAMNSSCTTLLSSSSVAPRSSSPKRSRAKRALT